MQKQSFFISLWAVLFIDNIHLFAFPINLIIGVVVVFAAFPLSKCTFLKKGSIFTIAAMVLCCFATGFVSRDGVVKITRSYPFALFMVWFLLITASTIVAGIRAILSAREVLARDVPFILCHLGLWMAIFAGYFGSADKYNSRMVVERDCFNSVSILDGNTTHTIPFGIKLEHFDLRHYPSGEPSFFEATLLLSETGKVERRETCSVSVNHPYRYQKHDIYLSGYDAAAGKDTPYCTLMVSKDPWKGTMTASIVIMLLGALAMLPRRKKVKT